MAPPGRVGVWRGGGRPGMSVAAPFVWRCLSGSTLAPFPHPSHRTGHADFPASGSRTRSHCFAEDRGASGMMTLKRVYEPAGPEDGLRVLVDRRWPRALNKATAAIDRWEKQVAPSA